MPKSAKLSIGLVIDDNLDRPDGVQQYVMTVGRWLHNQGHHVIYIAGKTNRKDIGKIVSFSRTMGVQFNGNRLRTPLPSSKTQIKKFYEKNHLDILHIQVPYSPYMAGKVLRAKPEQTAVIGTFHVLPHNWLMSLGVWLLGLIVRSDIKHRFDKMLAVSEPAQAFSDKLFKTKSIVLSNAVDLKKYSQKAKSDNTHKKQNIVFLGRLVERKGCHILLRALSRLRPDAEVHICGDGPDRRRLEQYVLENDLVEIVKFHGFVTEDEKVEFLRNADICVFPSLSGESFGIVLIESMAASKGVVLAADNPGYASVMAGAPECLFDAGSSLSLEQVLNNALNNKEWANSMHSLQKTVVKQFDIETVGPKLLQYYREAIMNNREKGEKT